MLIYIDQIISEINNRNKKKLEAIQKYRKKT